MADAQAGVLRGRLGISRCTEDVRRTSYASLTLPKSATQAAAVTVSCGGSNR
jgi:hypothetical protein